MAPAVYVWVGMLAISVPAWAFVARRGWRGETLVARSLRRPVPWRLGDVLIVAVFLFFSRAACWKICLLAAAAAGWIDDADRVAALPVDAIDPQKAAIDLAGGIAGSLATIGFSLVWILSQTGATLADLGLRCKEWRADVVRGVVAFAAIAAPIYGMQALLSQFVTEQHPIVKVLKEHPSWLLYVLSGTSALAIAPLAEEFFFRGILQGWLESIAAERPADEMTDERLNKGAIVASSAVFAAMHIGQGAAPVPLFFFALVLGYLYQQTHRLTASITLHFCLNAASFAALCLLEQAPP